MRAPSVGLRKNFPGRLWGAGVVTPEDAVDFLDGGCAAVIAARIIPRCHVNPQNAAGSRF